MEGVIAIIMVFSIPLAAILTSFYYKLQKLKLENGKEDSNIEELKKQIGYLMAENEDLKERVSALEQHTDHATRSDRKPLPDYDLERELEKIKLDKNRKD